MMAYLDIQEATAWLGLVGRHAMAGVQCIMRRYFAMEYGNYHLAKSARYLHNDGWLG